MTTSSLSSLTTLLTTHSDSLTTLYSSLTLAPNPLIESNLSKLYDLISQEINQQTSHIEQLLATEREKIRNGKKKVQGWYEALGEPVSKDFLKEEGDERGMVLEEQIEEVERVIESLRGRIEQRGKEIVQVQKELYQVREVLGESTRLEMGKGGVRLDEKRRLEEERGWEELDLRGERLRELEGELERYKGEIVRRQEIINVSASEILTLYHELGPSTSHEEEEDPLLERVWLHLGIGGSDKQTREDLLPTKENLTKVQEKRVTLEEEQARRHETIQTTYDRLYPLWTMLGVSEVEMDQFVTQFSGSTLEVIAAYQTELDRMLNLRRSNLSSFINAERTTLTSLWDQLYVSHSERVSRFPEFTISVDPVRVWREEDGGYEEELINENVSEELLIRHERERERLEGEFVDAKEVLERLEKYFEVVQKGKDLEAAAADPSRLTARGSSTRLLLEERDRKRIAREKPKLEADLRALIPEWESKHRRPFLVDGIPFIDSLDQQQRVEEMEKENKRRTKLGTGGAAASSSTRPLRPQQTGSVVPSVAPLKRQMTGASIKSSSSTSSTSYQPPAAKRQVPMTTGSSTNSYSNQPPIRPRSVLGESSSRIRNTPGGVNATPAQVSRSRSNTVSSAKYVTPTPTGGPSGMRIPSGWGANIGLQPQMTGTANASRLLGPQRTGQFRPRPSTTR